MVVLLIARSVTAVAGALLVLAAWVSVIRTLVVPRRAGTWVTRWVHPLVIRAFQLATSPVADYRRQDRILAGQAPAILLAQLAAWLGVAFVGYALLLWSVTAGGMARAFADAGSSLFTLGFFNPAGAAPVVIVLTAAVTGLVIITLQIAYLPTLYSAFNRRETEVTLLNARGRRAVLGPGVADAYPLRATLALDMTADRRDLAVAAYYPFPAGQVPADRKSPPSPLSQATRMSGPIIAFWGDHDEVVDMAHAKRLAADLAARGVDYAAVIYPGIGHSFMRTAEPGPGHDASAAALDAWARTLDFLGRELSAAP